MSVAALVAAAARLRDACATLRFSDPVTHVYHPLAYAWNAHEAYLRSGGKGRKRVVFLGMNPGPWGMAQCGVPFGEISLVRDWIGIEKSVGQPDHPHPKRPILGFACERSEVSGKRLWGLFAQRYPKAEDFFADHFVSNYCPLVFMQDSGRNHTPDKLPVSEAEELFAHCDRHLVEVVEALRPDWLIGVGAFAEQRARLLFDQDGPRIARILHPSPASPAANRDFAGTATRQLTDLGIW